MGVNNLDKIFKPNSIAVIGASNKIGTAGYRIFRNLIGSGYEGVVYPINIKNKSIQGVQAYPTVNDLPLVVDLSIIAVPSKIVPDVIKQCGEKGIKGIVIISAGFKEIGEEGRLLEEKIKKIRDKYGLRILGPNCVGFILPYLNLNASFADSMAGEGNIALFSQSGAICGSILDWAASSKVGFSSFISVGSMLDIDFGDLIDYFGMDMHTRSILLYVESITDARKFMSASRSFARVKPIIVIKAGRYKEGAIAASSHTGALAGDDAIYNAAFKRAGIVRVKEIGDLFNCSSILAKQPHPTGSNLAIITNAGGPGVLATDKIIEEGGRLAKLSNETMENLNDFLPKHWSKSNPIDIIGDSDEEIYSGVIDVCLKDDNIDGILIICVPQVMANPTKLAERIIDISKKSGKPILTSFIGEENVHHARQILNRNGIPTYPTPEEAVEAYMYLYNYSGNLELLYETPVDIEIKNSVKLKPKQRKIFVNALNEKRVLLNEDESKEIIEKYGIKTTKPYVVKSEDQAVETAKKIGFPVVMKILSPQISHKSDIGGVKLDIRDENEIRNSYNTMMKEVKEKTSEVKIIGVTIQKMIKNKGYELILGSKKDPVFGSIILFGLGGIYTELFKDRAIGLPPLNQILARRIIEQTKAYKLLKGFRGISPVDIKKVEETLINFSHLIIDNPEIKEIDINPLIINNDEVIAVDARIILDEEYKTSQHQTISSYPTKYIKKVKMKDDSEVILRPIKPEDEMLWLDMFKNFSKETVRYRFFRIIKDTPHEMRTRYCNIDYDRELGIVAEINDKGNKRLLGVIRIIADPIRNKEAEFAIVVGDKWQRLGLGSEFMDFMFEIARDKGIKKIYGIVLSDNTPMIQLCEEKNFKITRGDPGEYNIEYEVFNDNKILLESGKILPI